VFCAGFQETDLPQALSPTDTAPPNPLAQIEDALDSLLTKLLAEWQRERKRRLASGTPPQFRVISAADLVAMPIKSDQEIWREIIIERPITGALEFAIHEIGEVLFERGGVELMQDVLERVASRHSKSYGASVSAVDHLWDDVGGEWRC